MSERWDVGVEWVDAWKVSWVGGWRGDACMKAGGRECGKGAGINGRTGFPASEDQAPAAGWPKVPLPLLLSGPAAPIPAGPKEEDPESPKFPQRRCFCLTFTPSSLVSVSAGTPRLSSN